MFGNLIAPEELHSTGKYRDRSMQIKLIRLASPRAGEIAVRDGADLAV